MLMYLKSLDGVVGKLGSTCTHVSEDILIIRIKKNLSPSIPTKQYYTNNWNPT